MGIPGFTSYVLENKAFFIEFEVRNTALVIDGSSLYRRLYLTHHFDLQHGGEYEFFADRIIRFFKVLSFCNIRPFVVLDGCMDHNEKNFRFVIQQAQTYINSAHALSTGSRGTNVPVLAKTVFRQVLSSLEVPFVQCIAGADREIVSLANEWNCPVLTLDSIFFTHDLRGGCLPTNHFRWDEVKMCKTSVKYINAQLFSIERLCLHFDHMNKDLLPLFATMAGSNSPDLWPVMRTFFKRAKIPERAGSSKDSSNDRFIGLLQWLAQFSGVQEALKGVLRVLGGAHGRGNVHSLLSSGMEQYSVSTSNLAPFFTEGAPLSNLPDPIRALPAWILSALAKGQLGIFALNVLLCKRVILHTQVEDFRLPSCNTTSQPIRQVLYGLLLHMKDRYRTTDSIDAEENLCSVYCVQEFGRQHLEVCPSAVPAILKESALHLPLETLNKVRVQIRLQVLLDTLGVEKSILPLVPSHLQLPVCVTCYWLTHAKPKPDLQHLQSLLLGIVIGEFSRQKHIKGKFRRGQRVVWKRVRQLRVKRQSGGPDRDVAHTFCQWQSCLRMSLLLNQLLCFPLPEPECAWLYRGTLVHQVVKEMREGKTLNHLIEGLDPLQQLFEILLGAVKSSVGTGDFFKKRKKKGKKGKRCTQDQKQDQLQTHAERGLKPRETPKHTEHLSNRSAALECEDDDDDDEEREDEEDEDFDDDDDDYGEELQWLEEVHLVRVRFTTTHRITCGRPLIRVRKPHRGLW